MERIQILKKVAERALLDNDMIPLQKGQFRSRFPKIKRYLTYGRTHRSAPTNVRKHLK